MSTRLTSQTGRWVGVIISTGLVGAAIYVPTVAATAAGAPPSPHFYAIATHSASTPQEARRPAGTSPASMSLARNGSRALYRHTSLARSSHPSARPQLRKASGEQVLQAIKGIAGAGNDGVAVAAGPHDVVELSGSAARVFGSATGAAESAKPIGKFFGVAASVTVSEPTVVYDPVGRRFVAAAVAASGGDTGLVLRISKSTGTSKFGSKTWFDPVRLATGDSFTEAHPRIGVSKDKLAITVTTDSLSKPNRVIFLAKAAYYKGKHPFAWASDLNSTFSGQAPAVNQTSQPNLFIAVPGTSDITVTTYVGSVVHAPPVYSKNVMYPTTGDLIAPPAVPTTGDTLDLGSLAISSVAWRDNKLWAAIAADCSGRACVRVFGVDTGSGVSLAAEETLQSAKRNWFSPALALDTSGNVHVTATEVGVTPSSPSQIAWVRKGTATWSKPRYVTRGNGAVSLPPSGGSAAWWNSNAAATDPTSPWDVWVAGAAGDSSVAGTQLGTRVARVSYMRNSVSLVVGTGRGSHGRVGSGRNYVVTIRLVRPGGGTIKGLPVQLLGRAAGKGPWKTIRSGSTASNGKLTWPLKVKHTLQIQGVGKAVKQVGRQGVVIDAVSTRASTLKSH